MTLIAARPRRRIVAPTIAQRFKVNITDKPEITLNQSSVPEETVSNSVDVSFLGFQVSDEVTFSVGGAAAGER